MSSYVKLVAVLSAGLFAMAAADTKTADDKSKKADSTPTPKEATDKKSKKDKKKDAKPPEDPSATPKPVRLPVPTGENTLGLRIPYRDAAGKLKMMFNIGIAKKIDENNLDMDNAQVETFNDDGEHEMAIDLPKSTLELATWDLTAHQPVTIKREDFDLVGNEMIFNLRTKIGGLQGDVRMTIYNLDEETGHTPAGDKPAGSPAAPAADKPAASPTPAAASPAPAAPKAK